MKKIREVLVIIMFVLVLSGCGESGGTKDDAALAVVAGVHSNGYEIPFGSQTITKYIFNLCYRHGFVTFINVDGDPKPFYQTDIPAPAVSGLSSDKMNEIADEYTQQLISILKTAQPHSSEVDTLKAIRQGAQSLAGKDSATTDKVLLVLDSGIATTGYMSFTSDSDDDGNAGLLYAKPEDVVIALESEHALCDLTGVDVVWAFCGEAAMPQTPLNADEKDRLMNIWRAVLEAGGAESVTFTNDFASCVPYEGLPEVSVIETEGENIRVEGSYKAEKPVIKIGGDGTDSDIAGPDGTLDRSRVSFVGDKDIFLDKEKARDCIADVAELLREYPDNSIYIVGTTATGRDDTEFCKDLSERRAKAVADVLIDMGIDEDRLIPVGLGYEDYWHIDDLDESGHQIEDLAAQNRKVMIIDTMDEEAKHIFE